MNGLFSNGILRNYFWSHVVMYSKSKSYYKYKERCCDILHNYTFY